MRIALARSFLLLSAGLGACSKPADPAAAFLAAFGRDDFSVFAHTALQVRDFDEGEAVVFLYKGPARCFAVYRFNYARHRSRFVKFVPLQGGCSVFSPADTSLVQRFMRLRVTALEVNKQGTVYVTVRPANPLIQLVKTRDWSQTKEPLASYIEKGNGWFEHRAMD